MKYFIAIFGKAIDEKSIKVKEIIGLYSQEELFRKMEDLHHAGTLFAVYTAECVLDFS